MFLTTHAAVGILISQHVHDPLAAFGLAFASHFVLDFIPHGDEHVYHDEDWKERKRYRRVVVINAIDGALLLGLTLWATSQLNIPSNRLLVVGILGSVLPDFLNFLFPVVHERFSWIRLMRWLYAITKPTGLRYVVRSQNWIHNLLHHKIIRNDVPFIVGLIEQALLVVVVLGVVLRTR